MIAWCSNFTDFLSFHSKTLLIPVHSTSKANYGGKTPFYLKVAQLKAGSGCLLG